MNELCALKCVNELTAMSTELNSLAMFYFFLLDLQFFAVLKNILSISSELLIHFVGLGFTVLDQKHCVLVFSLTVILVFLFVCLFWLFIFIKASQLQVI